MFHTNSNPPMMFEYDARAGEASGSNDALFLERLDTFMEKSLGDIKAFAARESRPYEETRRCIAQWHAKYLFQPSTDPALPSRAAQVRSTLCNTSNILESLSDVTGVQSFFLAIDPNDPADGGFLGGTLIGRQFWRGMRGGGDTGARAFRAFYTTQTQTNAAQSSTHANIIDRHMATPPPRKVKPKVPVADGSAKHLKNELYETVRHALRTASGVPNAEMKWTNPEKLDAYRVRLVGWPEGVPAQNPSMLKVGQNKLLLESILSGAMRFEKLAGPQTGTPPGNNVAGDVGDPDEDFSWAYDADAQRSPVLPPVDPPSTRSLSPIQRSLTAASSTSADDSVEPEPDIWRIDPIAEGETTLASYNVDYSWGDGFSEGLMGDLGAEWDDIGQSYIERPRKRARSEDPGSQTEGLS